jgi:hypothetical protein
MEVTIDKCRFTLPCRTMSKFVGRQAELSRLVETTRKKSASFVIVKGRRRVGKSRLIQGKVLNWCRKEDSNP